MGKASRRKQQRRKVDAAFRTGSLHPDVSKSALIAEHRGRQVAPTIAAYSRACRTGGWPLVRAALISRHNQRMTQLDRHLEDVTRTYMPAMHIIPSIDAVLMDVGYRPGPDPAGDGTWQGQIAWAVDQELQASRLAMAGHHATAALLARIQLDRWTSNRAHTFGFERWKGETTSSFTTRVWQDERNGALSPAGDVWQVLSEALHGRGPIIDSARWAAEGLRSPQPPAARVLPGAIVDAQLLALRQIRGAVRTLARSRSLRAAEEVMISRQEIGEAVMLKPPGPLLWPVTYDLLDHPSRGLLSRTARTYWDSLRLGPADSQRRLQPALAFAERRSRALDRAQLSLELEEQLRGPIEPFASSARLTPVVLAAEAAALAGLWKGGPTGAALLLASTALRGASWLWLEDELHAPGAMRSALEGAAQARTHRLKPDKASRLEAQGRRVTPARWIEASGHRRLALLNRTLGEFAHVGVVSDWTGAFETLVQIHDGSDEHALHLARGYALDITAALVFEESIEVTRTLNPTIAQCFEAIAVEEGQLLAGDFEDLQDRVHFLRLQRTQRAANRSARPDDPDLDEMFGTEVANELRRTRAEGLRRHRTASGPSN
jgi:hypothetical protein